MKEKEAKKTVLKWLRFYTVKSKLLFYSLLILALMAAVCIYAFVYIDNIAQKYNLLFGSLYEFDNVSSEFNKINNSLESVLSLTLNTGETNPDEIRKQLDNLQDHTSRLIDQYSSLKSWVGIRGLQGMIQTFSETADSAMTNLEHGYGYFEEAAYLRKVRGYIQTRFSEIMSEDIRQSSAMYQNVITENKRNIVLFLIGFLIILILNIFIVLYFTRGITRPIASLSRRTERIAAGDLYVEEVKVRSEDELGILSASFNKMASNIRTLINQITEKADVESMLREEEMKNLKVVTELKQSELKVLQSQINPHFLFNTLNTIARMAMFEQADETLKLIESTADLLRYNLGKIHKEYVTLRDEIDSTKEYIYIQNIRFSDRITFEFDIDESVLDVRAPYLILQPLVENAIIHGIEPMERDGKLKLSVFKKDEQVIVQIEDNGKGIPKQNMENLFVDTDASSIGLNNVRKRIEYMFGRTDLLKVDSEPGKTTVTIIIPGK